jgi:hypothetical protein
MPAGFDFNQNEEKTSSRVRERPGYKEQREQKTSSDKGNALCSMIGWQSM